jgi:hypothetical protein
MIMDKEKNNSSRLYYSSIPAIISFVTAIVPVIVLILGLSKNPWFIIGYSVLAIPVGIISIVFGLVGLKTKLYKLSIVSLIIVFLSIIFMIMQ